MAGKEMRGNAELFESALNAEGITGELANLARSIYFQESGGGRNTTTSNAGAVGGMQVRPATFREVADKHWDINNPYDNARGGIRYLAKMFQRGGGDVGLAAAGYYGGGGGQDKARMGIAVRDPRNPDAPDTLQYAAQVAGRLGKAAPVPQPGTPQAPTNPAELNAQIQQYRNEEAQSRAGLQELAANLNKAPTPEANTGPDPWAQFLATLTKKPEITPKSLDYGNTLPLDDRSTAPIRARQPTRSPNMDVFKDWMS